MTDAPVATVLVVDDNPATRYSTSRVLKNARFNVLEASMGVEAVSMASKYLPDAVVLDVNLPDIDGFQVCRELRSLPETSRTPVIHLSATYVTDLHKVQGLEAGADGYLTHPVEPLVLIATVKAFIRTRDAEEQMRKSEAKFRAIFENAQNGICLFNQDFEFTEANQAMSQMLKRSREELIGKNLQALVSPQSADQLAAMSQYLKTEGSWRGTLPLLNLSGNLVEMDWRLSGHSVPGIWLAIVTDATERVQIDAEREQLLASERAARAAAERANRLKDDFLATLSHELRTPLSAIVGWAQILKLGRDISQSDVDQGIEAIERNAKIQTQLIEDLLDVARITSGKLRLDTQPVDMNAIAMASLDSVMPAVVAKEVEIIRQFEPGASWVAGDSSRLQQVVWNLVSNAVKFSQKGGKVFVKVRRIDSYVQLSVADEGQGISAEFLPHIFERFRQEDASTTRHHGGLGLGLAIVKHLVELHGGTVHAESGGAGQGAEFFIRLPVTATLQSVPSPPKVKTATNRIEMPNYQAAGDIEGIEILVVDDDADTRDLLKRLLEDCGARVAVASDMNQALEAIRVAKPQLLISDIGMPNQNGYELIRRVRQSGYDAATLPAIALTAFVRNEDRQRALLAGFQLHLEKPVDPGELVAGISLLMKHTTSHD